MESVGHGHAAMMTDIVLAGMLERYRRQDCVILAYVDCVEGIGRGDHLLMQFLAGTYAHLHLRYAGGDGRGHVLDVVRRNLRDEDLAAEMMLDGPEHTVYTGLQRDVEARHAHVGDWDALRAAVALADEEGDHAAARTHHVAVAHHGEAYRAVTLDIVGGGEEFVARQLGGSVKIDRGARLVGGERHHMPDSGLERGVYHVLRSVDVGLDALLRVVLGCVHLLDGGGVDDYVDALAGALQALAVADIPYEEPQLRILVVRIFLLEFELFELIAGIDHYALHPRIAAKYGLNKLFSERTGSTGDQYRFIVQHCFILVNQVPLILRPEGYIVKPDNMYFGSHHFVNHEGIEDHAEEECNPGPHLGGAGIVVGENPAVLAFLVGVETAR